jgi:hypothetical protein
MDMVPAHTDLKAVEEEFSTDQVEGFYDDDTKEICIPSLAPGRTNRPSGQ